MNKLAVGDVAPAFTLPASTGGEVSLSDFAGHRVVVYFYPAAMTPGCTRQAVDFQSATPDFAAQGLRVIGISPDPVAKIAKFRAESGLDELVLLSDPARDVLQAYGAYGAKMLYGKEVTGVIRSTFLVDVDAEGVGRIAVAQYNVRAAGHVDRLRRDLGLAPVVGADEARL